MSNKKYKLVIPDGVMDFVSTDAASFHNQVKSNWPHQFHKTGWLHAIKEPMTYTQFLSQETLINDNPSVGMAYRRGWDAGRENLRLELERGDET